MAKRKKNKKKKWSKLFAVKTQRGAMREKYKEEKVFHLWRPKSQILNPNKKTKKNKYKCRIKVVSNNDE